MSRSYKKYPSGKCERSCKWGQRQANKKIRHTIQTIPNGICVYTNAVLVSNTNYKS